MTSMHVWNERNARNKSHTIWVPCVNRQLNGRKMDGLWTYFIFHSYHSISYMISVVSVLSNHLSNHVCVVCNSRLGLAVCILNIMRKMCPCIKRNERRQNKTEENTEKPKSMAFGLCIFYFVCHCIGWLALPWGQFTNLRVKKCFCSIWIHGFTFVLAAIIENNYRCV